VQATASATSFGPPAGAFALNVVFDLGGVVFNWQPDVIVRSVFDDPATRVLVREEIIDNPDWLELDRGTLSLDEAIVRGTSRTGLTAERVAQLFNAVPHFLTPIEGTIDLIREVRSSGHPLFVLSNMHLAGADFLESKYDIWDLFEGIVFSARIQQVKPEPGIYEHLLVEHRLDPAETVFIDDICENLEAASTFGIHTIQFIDATQCRQELSKMNCL
jgi:putative hydrolase of the HAD superfamily